METSAVENLFERYERFFRQSLAGDIDMEEVASLYASEFMAASPAGVMAGKNDEQFGKTMAQGHLVQKLDGEPKIFGWVSGDEQALLRKHGII